MTLPVCVMVTQLGHNWKRELLPVEPRAYKKVRWTCQECGLQVFTDKGCIQDTLDEECISQGSKYANCDNYKESLVAEIMES
jgi:hypothetical protein